MAYVSSARARRGPVKRGCALFEKFHRYDADRVVRRRLRRRIPRVLVRLGRLKAVVYTSDKGSTDRPLTYIHFMERQPLLTCDTRGRQLYIVGGRYRVTERGLEG